MEVGLKFVWLLLAAGAFLLWGPGVARPSSRRRALRLAALGCALALLFPVISVTDDLHPQLGASAHSCHPGRENVLDVGTGTGIVARVLRSLL